MEVMRQGSFAAVARERNIDPSSVSRAIALLEQELGVKLLQRTTRQISPTEAGTTYFNRIEPLVEELQQAVELVSDISGSPKGTIRVTASVSFGIQCIVPLLDKFQAKYPELTIELLLTDAVVDLLTDRVDLAVRLGLLEDSTLIAQRLIKTNYVVCASSRYLERKGEPNQPNNLDQHNCLLFPLAGFRSRWLFKDRAGLIETIPVKGNTIISNAIALKQCTLSGMGLTLLPRWLIDPELESGKLTQVLSEYEVTATDFNTSAWLVYPSRTYVPLKVRLLVDFLKQHFLK
ncbi:MAG: LysR family transcriptional regulator [Hydrococcus sp. SU_1_0]|nr:LysR family transcriptional regulator [Hydrococcus sp. SU_1_0]